MAQIASLNSAQINQIITYLIDADDDLHRLERAGVDVGYPRRMINRAVDDLQDSLSEE